MHLADGDLVETFQTVALWKFHMNKFRVHPLDVCEYEQLLHGGMVTHVAAQFGIGVAPLFRGQSEESDIEEISLGGIGDSRLIGRDFRRDKMFTDSIGMDAVVELGEGAVEVPGEGESAIFIILETLELFD